MHLMSEGKSDNDGPRPSIQEKMKKDEDSLRKRFAEQVRLEEMRFRQWEQKVYAV